MARRSENAFRFFDDLIVLVMMEVDLNELLRKFVLLNWNLSGRLTLTKIVPF